MCILCSFTMARIVSAAAAKSEYARDLEAKSLWEVRDFSARRSLHDHVRAAIPVCSGVIFEIEIILPGVTSLCEWTDCHGKGTRNDSALDKMNEAFS